MRSLQEATQTSYENNKDTPIYEPKEFFCFVSNIAGGGRGGGGGGVYLSVSVKEKLNTWGKVSKT